MHFSSAGMKCIITYTSSTEGEDFYGEGADAKLLDLGGASEKGGAVTLKDVFTPLDDAGDAYAELHKLLPGKRDD